MPRKARLLRTDEQTVYHVISQTALDGVPLGETEKDYLVKLFKELSRLYFVEVIGYSVLGNHFHLLIRMLPGNNFSDKSIEQRFSTYFDKKQVLNDDRIPVLRKKYSNLSEFVKDIKMGFSRFYNRLHNRRGVFWADRFKSVILENGETLINCLAFIDLIAVRAEIVRIPEEYRWCSIGYHFQTSNKGNFLSLDFGLKEYDKLNPYDRFIKYRRFLYEIGIKDYDKTVPQANAKTVFKDRCRDFLPFLSRFV